MYRITFLRTLALVAIGGMAGLASNAATAGAGGCHGGQIATLATEPRAATGTTVMVGHCWFEPVVLEAPTGATVTFDNPVGLMHGVAGEGWGELALAAGSRFEHRFDEPGIYPYACQYHPGMVGAIVVADDTPPETNTVAEAEATSGGSSAWAGSAALGGIAGALLTGAVVMASKRITARDV